MYSYKQRRHNELMSKLQNSYEENKNILKMGGNDLHGKLMETHFHSKFSNSNNNTSKQWLDEKQSLGSTRNGFVMPRIKYRHL